MFEIVCNQLNSIKGQLEYVKNALLNKRLAAWEIKEYSELKNEYQKEIERLENHIEENKAVFYGV